MVKFAALQSAKIPDSKVPNRYDVGLDDGLEKEIIMMISKKPKLTMAEIAKKQNVTKRTIERVVKSLREKNVLERKGGKHYTAYAENQVPWMFANKRQKTTKLTLEVQHGDTQNK